jgi:hypothetical protein
MAANESPLVSRLNPVDRLGRTIDPEVLAAAEEIFPRALEHGLKLLGDSAVIANALEEVAAAVTRVVSRTEAPRGDPAAIKNLPGYVFRAFVRHVNRLRRKQLVLVSSNGDRQASTLRWADPSRDFETKILVDECLAQCDFVTQDMFWRRVQGFSWAEIGKIQTAGANARSPWRDDVDSVYRWHFDAVPYTVLLYLTDVRREDGGALEIVPNCQPHQVPDWTARAAQFWPAAGTLVLMDGTRCYHRVAPLLRPSVRFSIPLVYPNTEGTHERPAGLDSYLYGPVA